MKMKILIFTLGFFPLLAVGLCGCGKSREITEVSVNTVDDGIPKLTPIDETGSPIDSPEKCCAGDCGIDRSGGYPRRGGKDR